MTFLTNIVSMREIEAKRQTRGSRASLVNALIAVIAMLLVAAVPAFGQTPEGTVITNTATVTWSDANSNSYTPVNAQAQVTVGFQAGLDAIAQAASVTPASPSTADTIGFWVKNIGNGVDSVSVAEVISNASVMTVTGYRYAATTYGNIGALNTALAADSILMGDSAQVQVVYDVPAGQGGQNTNYTLTATSLRDGAVSDNDVTNIAPPATYLVATTPDGSQNVQQLPSNGTNYTFTFTVENTGNLDDDFDLLASSPGSAVITIVSVNAVAGDSTQIALATGVSQDIDVVYSVADVAAGSTDTLELQARSVAQPATLDDGYMDLTVIRPAITMTKEAYRDDKLTAIGAGLVVPGEYIQYKITVTNAGTAAADTVHVDDLLPVELAYDSYSVDAAGWTIAESGGDIDADLSGALAPAASRFFWIRVRVN